ncbi:RNase H family protein [Streptomyces sp. NPDC051322]|uniref:ribonuclease HI n=1 Tax=Streptomyces sp. NPDC051322 TaxID=3154645 RepID=UPI00344FBE4E
MTAPSLTALVVAKRSGRRAWALAEHTGWSAEAVCPRGTTHAQALLAAVEVLLLRPPAVQARPVALLCDDQKLALALGELGPRLPYLTVCAPRSVIGGSLLHNRASETVRRILRDATGGRLTLTAASDGSHASHTRRGSWAWLAEDGTFGFGHARCTEPLEAELHGVHELLKGAPTTHDLTVLCDSRAAIRLVNSLFPARPGGPWRAPEARSARVHGTLHAIRQQLAARPPVLLRWVRGHDGHPLNEGADRLALHARRAVAGHVDPGTARATAAAIATEAVSRWQVTGARARS